MAQVKLILRESVPSLGEAGDLVGVKPGYARNYLIPQGKAIFASAHKVRELEHHKRVVAEKVAKEIKDLTATRDRLQQLEARGERPGRRGGQALRLRHQSPRSPSCSPKRASRSTVARSQLPEPIKEEGDHVGPGQAAQRPGRRGQARGGGRGVNRLFAGAPEDDDPGPSGRISLSVVLRARLSRIGSSTYRTDGVAWCRDRATQLRGSAAGS